MGSVVTNQTQEAAQLTVDVGDGLDGLRAGSMGPTGRPMPAFPEPQPLSAHGPARIISMRNRSSKNSIQIAALVADGQLDEISVIARQDVLHPSDKHV